ncbi:MAG: aminotransferase class I/II-fold pyridoxal phosphate-dependent enzyme [Rhodobiaceae bacterium]|nr:aminotransferase class I/II-fold pyridoxal phosphate-dependent enzyme [Rhodobiaceae bacterium]
MPGTDRDWSLSVYLQRLFKLAGGHALGAAGDLYFKPIDAARREIEAAGGHFASFANYDYLGLSRHPAIKAAAIEAVETFGSGALASRFVGGERTIHRDLEAALARFVGAEATVALVSGFLTNETLISTLLANRDLIVVDELSHASILAGLKSTHARHIAFRHNDPDHLDAILTEHRAEHPNCLIVLEGLYSMDGDAPDLARMLDIRDRHRAWMMIDESHSHGVLGARGRGLPEYADVDPARIDLITGTLSKTFVSCGGFVAASREIVEILRHGLPGFVYSVGMPPVVAAMALKAVELAESEPERVARLAEKSGRMIARARAAGLDTSDAIGRGIVPILFPNAETTVGAALALMRAGIYAPPIIQAGVPRDRPRIRFFISADHEDADIDRAIDVLVDHVAESSSEGPRSRAAVSAPA